MEASKPSDSQEWADQVADGDPNGRLPDPGRGIFRLQCTPGGGSLYGFRP